MTPTYTIDQATSRMIVAIDGCDEAKALSVCLLARNFSKSWEDNEYTEWDEFDQLVAGAEEALGMKEVCASYTGMVEDGAIESMVIDYHSMPEATPMRACAAILSAQYANGLDADVGVVNEVVDNECVPVADNSPAPGL